MISAAARRLEIAPVGNGAGGQQSFTATVSGRESFVCTYVQEDGNWEGPCRRFTLVNPRSGTLVATVSWDDRHPLALSIRTLDGAAKGIRCCRSPETLELDVAAGSTLDMQVTLLGPWGRDVHQPFHVRTFLKP
jgi:hypothetical protein